jgi:hypothetical protein
MDEAAFERQLQHLLSHRAEPLSGWVLQMALNLDAETGYPIVVSLHKATDFRRSVVIAVLTVKSLDEIQAALGAGDQRQSMHHLFHDDIRSALRKVFGSMPGLATALGKMGGDAFEDPGHYDVLLTLLTPGAIEDQRQRALALRHASSVNSDLVTALARLDRELVHPILAKLFDGEATADTANAILRYVQGMSSTPISTDDLIHVSKGARSMRFQPWAAKLMARKADMLPSGPLEDHLDFKQLNDATQFAEIGQRFRNCLSSHVLRAAMGRVAFYMVKANPDLIVELVRYHMNGKSVWALQGIHGYDNRPVSLRHRRDIVDLLRIRGITELAPGYDARLSPELISVLAADNTDELY